MVGGLGFEGVVGRPVGVRVPAGTRFPFPDSTALPGTSSVKIEKLYTCGRSPASGADEQEEKRDFRSASARSRAALHLADATQ
jgi:hypothetical protein